jgi:hypothetical protein
LSCFFGYTKYMVGILRYGVSERDFLGELHTRRGKMLQGEWMPCRDGMPTPVWGTPLG